MKKNVFMQPRAEAKLAWTMSRPEKGRMESKIYVKPLSCTIKLHGSVALLSGSNTVNAYTKGTDITAGDED